MTRNEVIKLFMEQKDESYKKFNEKLIPGVKNVIGIRTPILKSTAKEISKHDYVEYLKEIIETNKEDLYYEEIMVYGFILGMIKVSEEERINLIKEFIPFIDNWAVCDSFCAGLKAVKKNKSMYWQLIKIYANDNREFYVRFAVVLLMDYFVDDEHIIDALDILEHVEHEGYYVKMAVAWATSVCYVKFPEKTTIFLEKKDNKLDNFTYNKAIQKIRESNRSTKEQKEYVNKLKR